MLLGTMLIEITHAGFFQSANFWFLDRVVGGPQENIETLCNL